MQLINLILKRSVKQKYLTPATDSSIYNHLKVFNKEKFDIKRKEHNVYKIQDVWPKSLL